MEKSHPLGRNSTRDKSLFRIPIPRVRYLYPTWTLMVDCYNLWPESVIWISANSLDPEKVQQNIRPDLDPSCLTLWCYSWKIILKKKLCWKISADDRKSYKISQHVKIKKCLKSWSLNMAIFLTLKTPIKTAADNNFVTSFLVFGQKRFDRSWESSISRRFSWNIMPFEKVTKFETVVCCKLKMAL